MDSREETYLGDSVYASFDGEYIWLRTTYINGQQHRIALDSAVFNALLKFARSTLLPPESEGAS